MKKVLFKDFDKVDKFGIQLLVAFSLGVGVIFLGWALSAKAEPQWVSKPVQCGPPEEVDGLMRFRNQKPLLGGVAVVTFENTQSPLPVILWYGTEDNNFHMVEYNFAGNQACIISVGDGVDFDVEGLVMEYEYEYEREGGT